VGKAYYPGVGNIITLDRMDINKKDSMKIIDKTVITRNYLTHYDSEQKKNAYSGSDLLYPIKFLNQLLENCLYSELEP